ncbi:MAG: 3-keto-5-aminohexanoate cleavage protein [Opitutaceae bacterium]|nr:3-keto-5-aminohexanoate cleavage protein [Opitutaceae bacterium]
MQDADSAPRPAAVVITVAPVDYAHIDPFPSAAALAEDICASHAAGAAVVHFHVTDAKGAATSDTTFFDGVVEQVRERSDIIVQASTGGVGVPWEVRTASLKARNIEMASLNMGSCNLFGRAYINTPADIAALGTSMAAAKVVPDMCFFEPGFFTSLDALENRVPPAQRNVYSLCLGFPGTLPATVANLAFMMSKLPSGAEWTLVHHGAPDFALLAAAVSAGGNIRVGFEDSRELGAGACAIRNAELVVRAAALVRQLGRTVATPAEVRRRYAITVPAAAAPAKPAALSRC